MHERDSESAITSRPYFAATTLLSHNYTVLKPNDEESSLKKF